MEVDQEAEGWHPRAGIFVWEGKLLYLRESKDIRRALKNPLTAPGGTVEVDRHRATKPSMSSN